MDPDGADGGSTVTTDTINGVNGEQKPDPAKLAQTAIIKQDVMLSGTSTQSPVSSVLTMPTVSMPAVSVPTANLAATSAPGGLPDVFFSVPGDLTGSTGFDTKPDVTGLPALPLAAINPSAAFGTTSSGGASGAGQILGSAPVAAAAPQLILTTGSTLQAQTGGQTAMQQLLIPVSTGNGTQQLLSIPVSLAAGGGSSIQILTTSNGQLIATNLAQPLSLATNKTTTQPPVQQNMNPTAALITQQNGFTPKPNSQVQPMTNGISSGGLKQTVNSKVSPTAQPLNLSASTANTVTPAAQSTTGLPQLITNAQGQIIAINNSVLPQQLTVSQNSLNTATNQLVSQPNVVTQGTTGQTGLNQLASVVGSNMITATQASGLANSLAATANINQLLPNTVSNSTESTTVDGINLDEIKEFAKQFKIRRLSLGLTQTQVGQALSATEGPSYSQSAICRFEKLDITPKSAQKIKPVLERWMQEAEERYKSGDSNLSEFIGSEPSRKRKRRTSFTPQALEVLNEYFEKNTHPNGAEMTDLSDKLNYDREVIRVWFCNKRQALKNTIKRLKAQEGLPS